MKKTANKDVFVLLRMDAFLVLEGRWFGLDDDGLSHGQGGVVPEKEE